MKTRVLWIEDNALSDLQNVLGPIYTDGHYHLMIAENASDGIRQIMQHEYEAIIVDIRLPPGDDPRWIKHYNESAPRGTTARLGLALLYSLLLPDKAKIKVEGIPAWISPERFAVFTVESHDEVKKHLDQFRVSIYKQKTAETSTHIILEILSEVASKSRGGR